MIRIDDDRNIRVRSSSDIRVIALEKRVRELEAAVNSSNGQISSAGPTTSTSFILPVNGKGKSSFQLYIYFSLTTNLYVTFQTKIKD